MVGIIKQNGKTAYNVVELVVDTEADVLNLSTEYAQGSTCFVIENSSVYMLNGNLDNPQWEPLD